MLHVVRPIDRDTEQLENANDGKRSEWKNRTIPQPEPVTRETDAEMQQENQAPERSSSAHTPSTGIGDSTVRPIARHIRDTEQLENANDEGESPEEWTPAKRIRLKSKPLVQSKKAERDAYKSRTHGK